MARADLWRLLVIWIHGGLYLDMKSVALKPLQPLKGKMVISRWYIQDNCLQINEVINWYVYAPKKNPVLRHLIDSVIENLKAQQSNTRSNEYYKLVAKALPCDGEAARVLYTTGQRALTLAFGLIPEALEEWVEESSHTSWENPLALDGALRYKSEEEGNSHVIIEGPNHYTNLIDVPLTSRTIYSTTMHSQSDQQWDVVVFAPEGAPR